MLPYEADTEISFKEEIIGYSRLRYSVPIVQGAPPPNEPEPEKENLIPQSEKEPEKPKKEQKETKAEQDQVREHVYLQTLIKGLAEAQGYKSGIEVPTPNGNGQVDVLLEKDGHTIAIEISVTTSPEWELHNIKKCLAAGYSKIVVCTSKPGKRALIEAEITAKLSNHEQAKVQVILPNNLQALLVSESQPVPTETIVKGYRVKVNYEPNATRQDLLQSIVKAGKKKL